MSCKSHWLGWIGALALGACGGDGVITVGGDRAPDADVAAAAMDADEGASVPELLEAEVDPGRDEAWGEAAAGALPLELAELADAGDVAEAELALEDVVDEADMVLAPGDEVLASEVMPDDEAPPPAVLAAECPRSLGSGPRHPRGAHLRTTDWLNLRTGPSRAHARLTVMPPGAIVTVLQPSCGATWLHVRDPRGRVGWSSGDYLRAQAQAPESPAAFPRYSAQRGTRLASTAWSLYRGHRSGGMCLRGVGTSLRSSIAPGLWTYTPGAHQFGVYARTHKAWFAARGFKVVDSGLPAGASFPKGTIMVFSRGRCGFHPTWGHVEIVVSPTVACSDFCRRRTDSRCGPSLLLYPTVR